VKSRDTVCAGLIATLKVSVATTWLSIDNCTGMIELHSGATITNRTVASGATADALVHEPSAIIPSIIQRILTI
jgi:hypothetical protein